MHSHPPLPPQAILRSPRRRPNLARLQILLPSLPSGPACAVTEYTCGDTRHMLWLEAYGETPCTADLRLQWFLFKLRLQGKGALE